MIAQIMTLVTMMSVVLVSPHSIGAASLGCPESPVTFACDASEKHECLCETVSEAISFLESVGLQTTEDITLKIVPEIPSDDHQKISGAYNSQTQELSMITFSGAKDTALGHQQPFGVVLTKDLWCSFAAHELAHAIIDQHAAEMVPTRFALEYVAYVTQLEVLDVKTREKILKEFADVGAFASIEEMSDIYYYLDPNRFAVKCYLHFMALDDPERFIEELISFAPRD